MSKSFLSSPITLAVVMVTFLVLIIGVIFISGQKAKQQAANTISKNFEAPTEAIRNQVTKVTLIKKTKDGQEEYVINIDGTIEKRQSGKLSKKTKAGFGQINSFLKDVENALDSNNLNSLPPGYILIIETNNGTVTVQTNPNASPSSSPPPLPGIIDEIIKGVDGIVNPTPTPTSQATVTPRPALPTPTPILDSEGNEIPAYMLASPFTCADVYKNGKPVKVSGVLCGLSTPNP